MKYVEEQALITAKAILLQNNVGNGITTEQIKEILVAFAETVIAAEREAVIERLQKEAKTLLQPLELSNNFKQAILNAEVQA